MSSLNCLNAKLWSVGQVVSWVGGLGKYLYKHLEAFEHNSVDGCKLLMMTNSDLMDIGITALKDQETILRGINLLQKMTYEMNHENLKTHASRLEVACRNLIGLVGLTISCSQSFQDLNSILKSEVDILILIENLLQTIFSTISWIERLQSEEHTEHRQFLTDKAEALGLYLKKKISEPQLLIICQELKGVCEQIIADFHDPLVSQPTSFDIVQLVKSNDEKLGLEIKCLQNGIPCITSMQENSLAASLEKFEIGDEIIQINEQNVLGWNIKILKSLIESSGDRPLFTLRKRPALSYMSYNTNRHKSKDKRSKTKNRREYPGETMSSSDNELLKENSNDDKKRAFAAKSLDDLHTLDSGSCKRFPSNDEIADNELQFNSIDEGLLATFRNTNDMPLTPSLLSQDTKRGDVSTSSLSGKKTKKKNKLYSSVESLLNSENTSQISNVLRKSRKSRAKKIISCCDLGGTDCQGWAWVKSEAKGSSQIADRWTTLWIILKSRILSFYQDPKDASPMKSFSLVWNESETFVLASDRREDMRKWMNKMTLASLENLDADDLHIMGGFKGSSKKIDEFVQPSDINEPEPLDVPEDLKRIYMEMRKADIGMDGRNVAQKRSTMLTASTSIGGKNTLDILKLLSLNRILKDKMAKLESIENFLEQVPITAETLHDFQLNNPFCLLSTPSEIAE